MEKSSYETKKQLESLQEPHKSMDFFSFFDWKLDYKFTFYINKWAKL